MELKTDPAGATMSIGSLYIVDVGYLPAWGWAFLLVLFLGALGYFGGFAALTHRRLGGQVDWKSEWLPHRSFWVDFGGMVVDGARFSRAKAEQRAIAGGYMAPKPDSGGGGAGAGMLRKGLVAKGAVEETLQRDLGGGPEDSVDVTASTHTHTHTHSPHCNLISESGS